MRAIPMVLCWLFFIGLIWPGPAQMSKRLWVLHEPDEIVEYDVFSFTAKKRIKIPAEVIKNLEHFSVNSSGQMLYVPGSGSDEEIFDSGSSMNRIWFWNGNDAVQLRRGTRRRISRDGESELVSEAVPVAFLSSDGRSLFWFENQFTEHKRHKNGPEIWVTTIYRVWQTDLLGQHPRTIVEGSFASCECATGACPETCPEAQFWAPYGGVDDFFLINHWIPGQLEAAYQATFLYHKVGQNWAGRKLVQPLENLLDGARSGDVLVSSITDSACCGWDNESNDQTVVIQNGKPIVIFDERKRYENPDYDVSFYTSRALLSPDSALIAMAINSSAQPDSEIRLSSSGKANQAELMRIRRSLLELPAVEVWSLGSPLQRVAFLPHATLAGWLNNNEILILENHVLVTFNLTLNQRRNTDIRVSEISYVFLR